MGIYIEFFKKAFQERYAYKFDFFTSLIGSTLMVVVQASIWSALYQNAIQKPISLTEMISYVVLAAFVTALTSSGISRKLGERVSNGTIVMELIRPINLKHLFFAEDFGNNIFRVIFSTLPAIIVISTLYGFDFKTNLNTWAYFMMSVAMGIVIAFYIHYIIGLFSFWLHTSWYIPFYVGALFQVFSGSIVPLWFYPDWLQSICHILPFRLIFFEPISIYLELRNGNEVSQLLLLQIVWIFLLYLLERMVWTFAIRKVVIHGG